MWNLNKTNLKGMGKKFTTVLRYLQNQGVLLGLNTAYVPLIEVILVMQGNLYYMNLSIIRVVWNSRLQQSAV